jgi:hypothetical protein
MASDGYSNKVLIGNWFEDRIQEDYLHTIDQKRTTMPGQTIVANKVIMDFGFVA